MCHDETLHPTRTRRKAMQKTNTQRKRCSPGGNTHINRVSPQRLKDLQEPSRALNELHAPKETRKRQAVPGNRTDACLGQAQGTESADGSSSTRQQGSARAPKENGPAARAAGPGASGVAPAWSCPCPPGAKGEGLRAKPRGPVRRDRHNRRRAPHVRSTSWLPPWPH